MIKGHSIDELFIISDTTPGQMPVWIMIIMLFGIFICYQCTYLFWSTKKVERLKEYQKILKKGPLGSCNKGKTKKKITNVPKTDGKSEKKPVRRTFYEDKTPDEEQLEDEAMEVFNNLKSNNNHLF